MTTWMVNYQLKTSGYAIQHNVNTFLLQELICMYF